MPDDCADAFEINGYDLHTFVKSEVDFSIAVL
jgi:hypothetical protein